MSFLSAVASLDAQPVNTVQTTIHIGCAMMGIGVTKDNNYVYVVGNGNSNNSLFMIDASTNTLAAATITLGGDPQFLAMAPNGNEVYVVNATTENDVNGDAAGTVSLIENAETGTPILGPPILGMGEFASSIAINPKGNRHG